MWFVGYKLVLICTCQLHGRCTKSQWCLENLGKCYWHKPLIYQFWKRKTNEAFLVHKGTQKFKQWDGCFGWSLWQAKWVPLCFHIVWKRLHLLKNFKMIFITKSNDFFTFVFNKFPYIKVGILFIYILFLCCNYGVAETIQVSKYAMNFRGWAPII